MEEYKKETTSHIIGSSSNLIGVCLMIITGLKLVGFSKASVLDEIAGVASIFLLISVITAYLSMHSSVSSIVRYRDAADYSFLAGVTLLVIAMASISFNIIH